MIVSHTHTHTVIIPKTPRVHILHIQYEYQIIYSFYRLLVFVRLKSVSGILLK